MVLLIAQLGTTVHFEASGITSATAELDHKTQMMIPTFKNTPKTIILIPSRLLEDIKHGFM